MWGRTLVKAQQWGMSVLRGALRRLGQGWRVGLLACGRPCEVPPAWPALPPQAQLPW